jgi:4-diphosphocytidyl-2-C-methyl-D-erythritol kinase
MSIGSARPRLASETVWRAPAKVNLDLHVLARRDDGYHELNSIVAFAGIGDWLRFTPGAPLALDVTGPTATAAGPADDNLVLRAARALAERIPRPRLGRFHLFKRLPVAAGLGGGSSDAAAALRALANANGLAGDDETLWDAARATGADVAVCLDPRARLMRGIGDRIGPALELAPMPALLVNPGVAVPTPQVFARLGLARGQTAAFGPVPELSDPRRPADVFAALRAARNDLQPSAEAIAPEISEVLAALSEGDGVRLARMSGSGATCFALYADRRAAARAARAIKAARPRWWVRATYFR